MERTPLWDGSAILDDDAPEEALAAAVELNLVSRVRFFAAEPDVRLVDNDESLRFITDRVYRVARARFEATEADQRIAAYLSHARSRPRYINWVVGPASRPADLAQRLQAHNMAIDMEEPGMVASLSRLTPPRPTPYTDSLLLYRIFPGDIAEIRSFTDVASAGFKRPINMGAQIQHLGRVLGPDNPYLDAMRLYLARVPSGDAVATAITFFGAGVVGLYTVATLPTYRRLGIGSALTYHALMDAHADGMRTAVLHASELGQGMYARLGFREICRITWLSGY